MMPASSSDLTLKLLDGFRLELRGDALQVAPTVQRLVAFLAVHNRPLQRLFVAGNLWIDSDEEHANANLRTALWRLHHVGVRLIESTRSHLRLAQGIRVDLHDAAARARELLYDPRSAAPMEQDAMRLAGDLLPDWYDDWVLVEREHFRQLRLQALEAICLALGAAGAYGAAVDAGLACVAAEPLRESAHRALMTIHLAQGNSGEAMRQYGLYSRLALDALGVAPSAEMQRMLQALPVMDDGARARR
jgi:DNA-binding SARP family transcriptional activator